MKYRSGVQLLSYWAPCHVVLAAQSESGKLPLEVSIPMTVNPGLHPTTPFAPPQPLGTEVRRAALLDQLGRERWPLTVLAAPAGYGKTTLLAQLSRERAHSGDPVVWVTLQAADAAPETVVATLLAAAGAALPALDLNGARQALTEHNPHAAAEHLAHVLAEGSTQPVVVLDQADRLGSDALRILASIFSVRGPEVFIALYHHGPLSLAERVARSEARLLGAAELAFSPGESRALLGSLYRGDPLQAHRRVDGWPLGLGLLALNPSAELGIGELVDAQLSKQSSVWQDALAEAGVLEMWTEKQLDRLGVSLPSGGLSTALRLGLPVVAYGEGMLRPHTLLREALDRRLRERPARYQALHARAAVWAERRGDGLDALVHFVRANQLEAALTLARTLAPAFERRAEYNVLRQMLEGFEEDQLPPELLGLLGTALMETGEVKRGRALLDSLLARDLADCRTLVMLSDLARRDGLRERAWRLVAQAQACSTDEFGAVLALRHRGTLLWEERRTEEAHQAAQEAVIRAEQAGDPIALAYALGLLALCHFAVGQAAEAEALTRRSLGLLDSIGLPWRTMTVRNNLATLMAMRGDTDGAQHVLAPALQHARDVSSKHQPMLSITQADIAFAQADFAAAAAAYWAALESAEVWGYPPSSVARCWTQLSEARRRTSDLEGAALALDRGRLMGRSGLLPYVNGEIALQDGLVAWNAQQWTEAENHLTAALQGEPEVALRARLYLADLQRRAGTLRAADLQPVSALLTQLGGSGLLRIDAQPLAALWNTLVQRGWWSGAPHAQMRIASTGQHLTMRTFGRLTVLLDGVPLRFPFSKCVELLVWLALYGPARRATIVDALWGGSRSASHHEYFRVMVRRLRAALATQGQLDFNPVPYEQGVYALSGALNLELDVHQLIQGRESDDPAELKAGLQVYTGMFLDGLEGEWIEELRQQTLEGAVDTALRLAQRLSHSEPTEALRAYQQAVTLNPHGEQAHLLLIEHLRTQGDGVRLIAAEHAFRSRFQGWEPER
ncbi:AAA family ATPase [Deinococcus oregonensis]|uniref:AAA family ATPase n=1 Tax=Deinococcus oregonensis TaxID=1805970 RepID=A0ABV6AVU5_9DEIO